MSNQDNFSIQNTFWDLKDDAWRSHPSGNKVNLFVWMWHHGLVKASLTHTLAPPKKFGRTNCLAGRARTNKRTDRQTDGRYQVHYLPASRSIINYFYCETRFKLGATSHYLKWKANRPTYLHRIGSSKRAQTSEQTNWLPDRWTDTSIKWCVTGDRWTERRYQVLYLPALRWYVVDKTHLRILAIHSCSLSTAKQGR